MHKNKKLRGRCGLARLDGVELQEMRGLPTVFQRTVGTAGTCASGRVQHDDGRTGECDPRQGVKQHATPPLQHCEATHDFGSSSSLWHKLLLGLAKKGKKKNPLASARVAQFTPNARISSILPCTCARCIVLVVRPRHLLLIRRCPSLHTTCLTSSSPSPSPSLHHTCCANHGCHHQPPGQGGRNLLTSPR